MKTFDNGKDRIVTDAIDGLIASSGGALRRFDADSYARVVVRADWDKCKVALISGGGSGHEPSHAGLVGAGLLTAAVCGGVYASPSVDAVLSAILAVTGPKGCLLIIKNYTGDRLNFGLAAEKAKAMGHRVEMIIVGDDIAIPDAPQPRGLAGTIFVHKVTGHIAEAGGSLSEVLAAGEALNAELRTLGVARDTCTVPGSDKQERIAPEEVEIGLGIHGEPGVEVKTFDTAQSLMVGVAARLSGHLDAGERYLGMFNDLGGLTGLERAVLFKSFMATDLARHMDFVVGPTATMTALDMPGFSVTMVPLKEAYREALLSPLTHDAWPNAKPVVEPSPLMPPELGDGPAIEGSHDEQVRSILSSITGACRAMEADLNELDAKVGDGDTGTTFAAVAALVDAQLDNLPLAQGDALLAALSDIAGKSMGGSSGVLLAIMFANASKAYQANGTWAPALLDGLSAMQKYGGAEPGDRTMIDALRPALEALVAGESLINAGQAARQGADRTAKMLTAKAGRSAYLSARSLDGFNDPGAEGVARIFEAIS